MIFLILMAALLWREDVIPSWFVNTVWTVWLPVQLETSWKPFNAKNVWDSQTHPKNLSNLIKFSDISRLAYTSLNSIIFHDQWENCIQDRYLSPGGIVESTQHRRRHTPPSSSQGFSKAQPHEDTVCFIPLTVFFSRLFPFYHQAL